MLTLLRPLAIATLLCAGAARAQQARADSPAGPTLVANASFEEGTVGEPPPGWLARPAPGGGYRFARTDEGARSGHACVVLESTGEAATAPFGNVMQSVDATSLRGQRVRLRAAVRVAEESSAQLWLRVDRPGGARGFFDNMGDRPIVSPTWSEHEIVGAVAPDAEHVVFGVFLRGEGKAWADDFSLEALGTAVTAKEPARELSERGLENLVAASRLLGYVRYFQASDEGSRAAWPAWAMLAVERAEGASDASALVAALRSLAEPVAPAVQVFVTGSPAPEPAPVRGATTTTWWRHVGVGNAGPRASLYTSSRMTPSTPPLPTEGSVLQVVDATALRGQPFTVKAWARAEVGPGPPGAPPPGASIAAWVVRPGGLAGYMGATSGQPVTGREWELRELKGFVADDAEAISIRLVLQGDGRAWFDDIALEATPPAAEPRPVTLRNAAFEEATVARAPGWLMTGAERRNGYDASVTAGTAREGKTSLLLARTPPKTAPTPPADRSLVLELGGGASCLLPVAVHADDLGTLPRATVSLPEPPAKPASGAHADPNRTTRLASVLLAWNVFQHFYPYFDVVDADWDRALREALRSAATDPDRAAFADTLRRMTAVLRDGHVRVGSGTASAGCLPFAIDIVEGRVVVSHVPEGAAPGLRRGDVVVAVDGVPIDELLRAKRELISAATEGWMRYRLRDDISCGDALSLTLEVDGPEGPRSVLAARGPGRVAEPRPDPIAEIQPGLVYVDLDRIKDAAFQEALPRLVAAKAIVFDVRGYPAVSPVVLEHLIDEPIHCALWNVPVSTWPDRQNVTWRISDWPVLPSLPRLRAKTAFLTDGRAISYAETFLGMVEHYRLGEIVGEPTAGTNGNVNVVELPAGFTISWTGMKVLKHDGSRHHGVGMQPTVPVSRTLAGVAAGRDELLEAAIAAVSRD